MSVIDSLYLFVFGSGLLGGFGHCVGMCGPVVATYSLGLKDRGIKPHLLYNLGRITTYGILGGLIGTAGSFTGVIGTMERFQEITLALIGTVMVIMGLSLGGWLPSLRRRTQGGANKEGYTPVIRFINRVVPFLSGTRSVGAYYPMGLVMGFVPCGLLYSALMAAAGAGSEAKTQAEGFLRGMFMLFLFGAGTSPAMLLLGGVVTSKGDWVRRRFYRGSAIMVIVMGVIFLYRVFKY